MPGITKILERLVDKRLEGTLSDDEARHLDRLLAASADARKYASDMEKLDRSLKAMPKPVVEPDMSRAVMDRVQKTGAQQGGARSISLHRRFISERRQLLKYAAVLLVGFMIGSAVVMVMSPDRIIPGREEAVATMAARSGQTLSFASDTWQLHVSPVVVDQMIILILSVKADDPLEVIIGYDPQAYRMTRIKPLIGDAGTDAVPERGMIRFGSAGDMVYQVLLNQLTGATSPILFEINKDGKLVYQRDIFLQ